MADSQAWAIEDLAREIDLIVFELEQSVKQDPPTLSADQTHALRRRLEGLRDDLQDIARRLF